MRIIQILAVLGVLIISAGFAAGQNPARVVVSKVYSQEILPDNSFLGVFYYDRISHVSSEVSGLVASVDAQEGDVVSRGLPLIQLDTRILEKEIQIHRQQIERSRLQIAHLEKNFQRIESLFQKGSASETAYDDVRFALDEALLQQATARSSLEKLQITKEKSIISSPFDGVVLKKNVDVGGWVSQGKAVMDIGSIQDLFVRVPVSEEQIRFLSAGQQVRVLIHAYDQAVSGTIHRISPIADAKTKNVFLIIQIPVLPEITIAQNMSATVNVAAGNPEVLAMIPRDALIKDQGSDVVYAVIDGKAVKLPVNVVRYMGDLIGVDHDQVTSQTLVVVEGNERLQPDQPVTVIEER